MEPAATWGAGWLDNFGEGDPIQIGHRGDIPVHTRLAASYRVTPVDPARLPMPMWSVYVYRVLGYPANMWWAMSRAGGNGVHTTRFIYVPATTYRGIRTPRFYGLEHSLLLACIPGEWRHTVFHAWRLWFPGALS
jgi:hypothetical protein